MHEPGHIIGERYRLEAHIGSGGMAEVWQATHVELASPVAVKFLGKDRPVTASLAERFLNEARLAASMRHRNVVEIIDFGKTAEEQPYMVMELLVGRTFADRLQANPPLRVPELIKFLSLALRGLTAVHQAGIVHRDLKPENIFCVEDADGMFPKLLDFGVSRAVAPTSSAVRSAIPTEDGLIVGTPQYMSPEQARGLVDIDLRTDIYSMSVILYEALTGRLPYDAPHVGDVLMAVMLGNAPKLTELRPDLGQALSDVISRGMSRDREERFENAKDMREALTAAAAQTSARHVTWKAAPVPKLGASSIRPPRPDAASLPPTREIVPKPRDLSAGTPTLPDPPESALPALPFLPPARVPALATGAAAVRVDDSSAPLRRAFALLLGAVAVALVLVLMFRHGGAERPTATPRTKLPAAELAAHTPAPVAAPAVTTAPEETPVQELGTTEDRPAAGDTAKPKAGDAAHAARPKRTKRRGGKASLLTRLDY